MDDVQARGLAFWPRFVVAFLSVTAEANVLVAQHLLLLVWKHTQKGVDEVYLPGWASNGSP